MIIYQSEKCDLKEEERFIYSREENEKGVNLVIIHKIHIQAQKTNFFFYLMLNECL